MAVVAIDCGKYNMKGCCGAKKLIFRNRVSLGHSSISSPGSYNVTFKKDEYLVGDSAKHSKSKEGKAEQENLLTTLVAITKLTNDNMIDLVYGESVNYYFNNAHKKKLIKLFKGTHQIEVDGEIREITIRNVQIFIEGIGHMFTDYNKYGQGTKFTVDMGGTTVQVFKTLNGVPNKEDSFSFPLGMYSIRSEVDERFKKELGIHLSPNEVEEAIIHGSNSEEKQAIIESVIKKQFEILDEKLQERGGIDLHAREIVTFVGGTSVQFKEQIEKHYKCAEVLDNGLFSNVEGFHAYGRLMYGN